MILRYSPVFGVLEKNPPKQGLKRKQQRGVARVIYRVLEKNPPKQGLKLRIVSGNLHIPSFREKSTKTRIETAKVLGWDNVRFSF